MPLSVYQSLLIRSIVFKLLRCCTNIKDRDHIKINLENILAKSIATVPATNLTTIEGIANQLLQQIYAEIVSMPEEDIPLSREEANRLKPKTKLKFLGEGFNELKYGQVCTFKSNAEFACIEVEECKESFNSSYFGLAKRNNNSSKSYLIVNKK